MSKSFSQELPVPLGSADFEMIVSAIKGFFYQSQYQKLGASIANRKRIFRIVFFLARLISSVRIGSALLVLAAYLLYPQVRRPRVAGTVFQFGLSANNERSFQRLDDVMAHHPAWIVERNLTPIPFGLRLRWLSIRTLWQASGALMQEKTPNPFVTVQQALGCASVMLFDPALEQIRPALVVVSNDHSPTCVAMRQSAQKKGLKVVYIQHAPINRYFPPLLFDLSILFDQVSRDNYALAAEACGTEMTPAVIFLSPFQQNFQQPTLQDGPVRIGICLSLLPNLDVLAELAQTLSASGKVSKILLRRHPRSQNDYSRLTQIEGVELSPLGETLDIFLEQVDLALVPNSGVTIECLHNGIPTFFVPNSDTIEEDHYGFVADGIVQKFSLEMLEDTQALNAMFDTQWRMRFGKYDATEQSSFPEMEETVRKSLRIFLP